MQIILDILFRIEYALLQQLEEIMEPKAHCEIIAEANKEKNLYFVDFWFSTAQAKQWLVEQIPLFSENNTLSGEGHYGLREKDMTPGKGWFVVNKCFDINEVLGHLNGYQSKK